MRHKVEVQDLSDGDPLASAIAQLIGHAISGGVRKKDEKMTLILPQMTIAENGGEPFETGEWEIIVKKMED